jgi:hypothetical protein
MVKICENGHITGYRNCSQCGSRNVGALRPFRIIRQPERTSAATMRPHSKTLVARFKQWRAAHRDKVAHV